MNSANDFVDLHMHSVFSTGFNTPVQLVRKAKRLGLRALALTDHNTLGGLPEFATACGKLGIEFLYGGEIWVCSGKDKSDDLVILGKNLGSKAKKFFNAYRRICFEERGRFVREVIEKIGRMGFDVSCVTEKEIKKDSKGLNYSVTVRKILFENKSNKKILSGMSGIKNPSYIEVVKHVYGTGCPAFVPRMRSFKISDAKRLADDMNFKIFLAHPGGITGDAPDEYLNEYAENGFGIEAYTYWNTEEQTDRLLKFCAKKGAAITGGSDYHGKGYGAKMGTEDRPWNRVPYGVFETIRRTLATQPSL